MTKSPELDKLIRSLESGGAEVIVMEMPDHTGPMDEIFSFRDPDFNGTGVRKWYHFNATAIRAYCEKHKRAVDYVIFPIEKAFYDHVMEFNGVEERKVLRLLERPDIACEPVLLAQMPNGRQVMIDGNHRVVIHWRAGLSKMGGLLIPEEVWSKFLVPFPDKLSDEMFADENGKVVR